MNITTSDIPQADKLEKVIKTVEVVFGGAKTDTEIAKELEFTERQARYYRHAAEILGYITNERNYAITTSEGNILVNLNDKERIIDLAKAVKNNSFFISVIRLFEKSSSGITEVEIGEYIAQISGADSQSTIPRRVKTVISWLEYLSIIIDEGENYKLNELPEIENEQRESIYPTNYKKEIDIVEERFTVFELLRKINQKKIDMNPEFQRNEVWKPIQRSQFIESILLNIPLPPLYFRQDLDGKYVIVDGLQRTSTLEKFIDKNNAGHFALTGLEALPNLNGCVFEKLKGDERTRIEDKVLLIYVLKPNVPMTVVYDIFNRINTGGTMLERQEIRNCIFIGASTKLLKELSDTTEFKNAIGYGIASTRMKDREAILRYLAFRIFDYELDYKNSLDEILEKSMRRINKMISSEIEQLKRDFLRVMILTYDFFKDRNFRLPTSNSRGRINIAILESVSHFFASKDDNYLKINKNKIIDNYFKKLLTNREYFEAVRFSTGSSSNVKQRFRLANKILGDV